MPLIIDGAGAVYKPVIYESEKDFEASVVELADQIFGTSSIYVDAKRRVSGNDIVSIPDGYVIDMAEPSEPKLFVLENEIVGHDPFKHIGIQMLKFVTSFEGAQNDVRAFLMEEISRDKGAGARLDEGCEASNSRNIDNYLDLAVFGPFRGVVVIDDARPELHKVLEKINANISVLELKTFEAEDGSRVHAFDTLYEEYESSIEEHAVSRTRRKRGGTAGERTVRRRRRAECDTIVVPAQEDGFVETFLGENRWYSIRIGAAMKERIKYIAAYQVAPVSAVTYIAEVQDIRPYEDSGGYMVIFKGAAKKIRKIPVLDGKRAPQSPCYVKREKLLGAKSLEEAMRP